MTPAETTKVLAYMASLWPTFKPTKEVAGAWHSILSGVPAERVTKAISDYAMNADSPFEPKPQDIFKTLRHQTRPERRVFGKQKALPAPEVPTLTEAEAAPWFAELHAHIAWVAAQKDAGTLNDDERKYKVELLKEAWKELWRMKREGTIGWVNEQGGK